MATINMPTIIDDDGTGTTGTDVDNAWMTAFKEAIEDALDAAAVIPTGGIIPYGGENVPTGWVLCNGYGGYTRTGQADLFAAIGQIYNKSFTADSSADTLTCTAHGFENDDTVTLWSENALPTGLDDTTTYYVINKTTDTLQLSASQGGAAVNFTDNGSGRMTIAPSTTFMLPDLRGRSPLGAGQGSGLTDRAMGENGGEEGHTLTINEMPSHTHNSPSGYTGGPGGDHAGGAPTWYSHTTGSTGSDTAHNTMQPYQVTNFIIKL